MLQYHRQQHGNLRYQCRTRRRRYCASPPIAPRCLPVDTSRDGFRRAPNARETDRRYPRRPEPLPLKILGRQDDFRSLTADCPATLTPERRAARQQDAQTEDHRLPMDSGQKPSTSHRAG